MPFAHICQALHLGNLLSPPAPLSGGYTHRMVRLVTTGGDFAVKLLNPEIMARPTAMANFRRAEALEALLEARNLPILPALTIGGQKMQQVGGQYLYVFEYFDGHPLREADITPAHCREMGRVLAQIHSIDRREASLPAPVEPIDWHALADALLAAPEAHAEGLLLAAAIPLLKKVTAAAEAAALRLPPEEALCHNDMDPKNVLWRGAEFRIIDLECLDYANPAQEMLDLAVSWAGSPTQEGNFRAFVGAYREAGGHLPDDPGLVYDSRRNYIDWLAYNARRARFDDPAERTVGRAQIAPTLDKIASDSKQRGRILDWMA